MAASATRLAFSRPRSCGTECFMALVSLGGRSKSRSDFGSLNRTLGWGVAIRSARQTPLHLVQTDGCRRIDAERIGGAGQIDADARVRALAPVLPQPLRLI